MAKKSNKILLAGAGLGAAFLLTRHETKILKQDADLSFVNTRLDEHGNAISDLQADVDYLENKYGYEEGTTPDSVKECCPIDATIKVGNIYTSEKLADYRLFMRFQNLNKFKDLKIYIKQIIVDVEGWDHTIAEKDDKSIFTTIVPKNTTSTGWKLVEEASDGKWFDYKTIGLLFQQTLAEMGAPNNINNRRGHFYPCNVRVYYQVTNPSANKTVVYGGWADIDCEIMEQHLLTYSYNESLTMPDKNFTEQYPGGTHQEWSGVSNKDVIVDYRNEKLWNPDWAVHNWHRANGDRPPHYRTKHPDFVGEYNNKVSYEYDSYSI